MSTTTSRMERAKEEAQQALHEGLQNTGKEEAFFKALGVGEARPTLAMLRTKRGRPKGQSTVKTAEQWWAPAHLVQLNRYLLKSGISSKMRTKALRCLLDGKDMPDRLNDALTSYTESLLRRG